MDDLKCPSTEPEPEILVDPKRRTVCIRLTTLSQNMAPQARVEEDESVLDRACLILRVHSGCLFIFI